MLIISSNVQTYDVNMRRSEVRVYANFLHYLNFSVDLFKNKTIIILKVLSKGEENTKVKKFERKFSGDHLVIFVHN